MNKPDEYRCAICGETKSLQWHRQPRDWPVPPICGYCESLWGVKIGATGGSFRDRRMAVAVYALSDALTSAASIKLWETKNGHA